MHKNSKHAHGAARVAHTQLDPDESIYRTVTKEITRNLRQCQHARDMVNKTHNIAIRNLFGNYWLVNVRLKYVQTLLWQEDMAMKSLLHNIE